MVTGHRARAVEDGGVLDAKGTAYEYEVLCRLREVLPAGVKVTVVADRGFANSASRSCRARASRSSRQVALASRADRRSQ